MRAPAFTIMTHLPGDMLDEQWPHLDTDQRDVIHGEMRIILDRIRSWKSPWGERICSIRGGSMRSIRVPNHRVGPCETEQDFNDYLIAPACNSSIFRSPEEFDEAMTTARSINAISHKNVFTYGDFAMYKIIVHDGHVSGFIDWECAGWYPDYWEFTAPMRWPSRDPTGGEMFRRLGAVGFEEELKAELALRKLTVDSWVW